MVIDGVLDIVLTDYNYYLKIMSGNKNFPYLYKRNMESFYADEIFQLEKEIDLLENKDFIKSENTKNDNLNEILENENLELENENEINSIINSLFNIEETQLNVEEVQLNEDSSFNSGSKLFLDAIKNKQVKQEEVHGVYIDEWQSTKKEEKESSFVPHGVYIDEWVSTKNNNLKEFEDDSNEDSVESEDDFIEEFIEFEEESIEYSENIENEEDKSDIENNESNNEEISDFIDSLLNDLENEFNLERSEEKQIDSNLNSINETEENKIKLESNQDENLSNNTVKEESNKQINSTLDKNEVIVVPASIRDFIKSNQGSTIEYVLNYYSKKDVEKAISFGKIYKRNGKLYI